MTDISKKNAEKVEEYFRRLRRKGVKLSREYQEVSRNQVLMVLERIGCGKPDMVDCVWCLLNNEFPSLFSKDPRWRISHGAAVSHIASYVGILFRGKKKLDREGRDYWLKPLCELGAIERVTFDSKQGGFVPGHVKPKSPSSAYRLESSFLNLLKSADASDFEKARESWLSEDKKRERLKVLFDSQKLAAEDSPGNAHENLIRESIEVYAKNFLSGYIVLYEDFADGVRMPQDARERLESAGVHMTPDDVWPDVILYNPTRNALWFLEAVTSDGEVDCQEWDGLQKICARNGKSLAGATTTYSNWKKFALRQRANRNLCVATRVWISEDPTKEFVVKGPDFEERVEPGVGRA